jgi:hypothetical protein
MGSGAAKRSYYISHNTEIHFLSLRQQLQGQLIISAKIEPNLIIFNIMHDSAAVFRGVLP